MTSSDALIAIEGDDHMTVQTEASVNALTFRVFNDQDINRALTEIYNSLQASFPLDFMNIPVLDDKRRVAHYRIIVTKEQVSLVDETVKLSNVAYQEAVKFRGKQIALINNSEESALLRSIASYLGIPGTFSTIAAITKIDAHRYAVLGLVAIGKGRFLEEHYQKLEKMYDVISSITLNILNRIEIAELRESLTIENKELRKRLGYLGVSQIIGLEAGLAAVSEQIKQVAPLNSPVLIMGETGVGKEVLANAIHQKSRRAGKPFVSLNCGAIPETLLESELFGHENGAFTGANELRKGYFEQADGGTIFMDEIGELSLTAQVKLLRLVQTMEFNRVGGQFSISIDVRIIAATNRNLEDMVRDLKFRKDLWYRLNVFPVQIPPLRDRKEDIPALAEHFLRHKSKEMNISHTPRFSLEALAQLQSYEWPGNVRELQNVIERAIIISKGLPISFPHLTETDTKVVPQALFPEDSSRFPTMKEMTIRHIIKSLQLSQGKIDGPGGAAELLDMHPSTLRGRIRKLEIQINRKWTF